MLPCDSNAFASAGYRGYSMLEDPAFRVRQDIGWQAWCKTNGMTATEGEAGAEWRTSFWLYTIDSPSVPHAETAQRQDSHGNWVWYFSTIGNYTETIERVGGHVQRNEYHHFVRMKCDRLMFAQNCRIDNGSLVIPSPQWFAPRRAYSSGLSAKELISRPISSPAIGNDGWIWDSKDYAVWQLLPKPPPVGYSVDAEHPPRVIHGISRDAIIYESILGGLSTEEIGLTFFGKPWPNWDVRMLYGIGGDDEHPYPLYWRRGGTAADGYNASAILAGLRGENVLEDVPAFMLGGNEDDLMAIIDPEEEGLAFDLCIMFRTYRYKTKDFTDRTYVANGYFNTLCDVRIRRVAPCRPGI